MNIITKNNWSLKKFIGPVSTALSIKEPSSKAVRTSRTPANAENIKAAPNTNHDPDNAQPKNANIVRGGDPEAGWKAFIFLKNSNVQFFSYLFYSRN